MRLLPKMATLYPETGDFVAVFGNKCGQAFTVYAYSTHNVRVLLLLPCDAVFMKLYACSIHVSNPKHIEKYSCGVDKSSDCTLALTSCYVANVGQFCQH